MKKISKKSQLYKYLNDLGVLERGDELEIKQAKANYRREYLTKYKKTYRGQKKHIAVILNELEHSTITKEAKKNGIAMPSFIKQSALAYLNNAYLTPHPHAILEIKQLVYAVHNHIKTIAEKESKKWYGTINNYDTLKQMILDIHTRVKLEYMRPVLLEQAIEQELARNPVFKDKLYQILKDNDSKKPGQKVV
ncbi:MAG: hypothetical protein IPK03_03410 [Bacteroidetes bacterium]|nr:hypothetical protein [Bacteroidota bacterium]